MGLSTSPQQERSRSRTTGIDGPWCPAPATCRIGEHARAHCWGTRRLVTCQGWGRAPSRRRRPSRQTPTGTLSGGPPAAAAPNHAQIRLCAIPDRPHVGIQCRGSPTAGEPSQRPPSPPTACTVRAGSGCQAAQLSGRPRQMGSGRMGTGPAPNGSRNLLTRP